MKQTAVEWLVEQIFNDVDLKDSILKLAINQAKEMEKKQIIEFAENWSKEILRSDRNINIEQYYNETFKSE